MSGLGCGFLENAAAVTEIIWNSDNWANSCNFYGDDLISKQVGKDDCRQMCVGTSGTLFYFEAM